jgi:hypothetical protein
MHDEPHDNVCNKNARLLQPHSGIELIAAIVSER